MPVFGTHTNMYEPRLSNSVFSVGASFRAEQNNLPHHHRPVNPSRDLRRTGSRRTGNIIPRPAGSSGGSAWNVTTPPRRGGAAAGRQQGLWTSGTW